MPVNGGSFNVVIRHGVWKRNPCQKVISGAWSLHPHVSGRGIASCLQVLRAVHNFITRGNCGHGWSRKGGYHCYCETGAVKTTCAFVWSSSSTICVKNKIKYIGLILRYLHKTLSYRGTAKFKILTYFVTSLLRLYFSRFHWGNPKTRNTLLCTLFP